MGAGAEVGLGPAIFFRLEKRRLTEAKSGRRTGRRARDPAEEHHGHGQGRRNAGGKRARKRELRMETADRLLLALINGILDMSKIESGNMALKKHRFDSAAATSRATSWPC